MEGVDVNAAFWRQRRVFLTGHTGFKGCWLAAWLQRNGADVAGYSLAPTTKPSLFDALNRAAAFQPMDIRDAKLVERSLVQQQPSVVFHLAAQSLVRLSYESPIETFETNVMGTVNVLDAVRSCPSVKAVVVVTTDKCYENREWVWPYREDDPLGGHDPYSSSKACAEIATASYRRAFLEEMGIGVATVRAGNVIGGGDWARDRIVPDMVRAIIDKTACKVRNPRSVRPWQHVLDPLAGYVALAEQLVQNPKACSGAWNFGPSESNVRTVENVVDTFCRSWGDGAKWELFDGAASSHHEARALTLDSSKARAALKWRPLLEFDEAIRWTADWYRAFVHDGDMRAVTEQQLDHFEERVL
nr:CDP-glucose 4,6-dehydratase [uncultured bacterium]